VIRLVSAAEAGARRYFMNLPNGVGNWVTSYMGVTAAEARARGLADLASSIAPVPVAYLVEQPPESTIAGHYHQIDQFQVFVSGDGTFGSKKLDGVHLHYAAAYTPYAPISAGRQPLRYFTLRPGFDPGAQWMPESRARLLSEKRAFRAETARFDIGSTAANVQTSSCTVLVDQDATGVGAWLYRVGTGARVELMAPSHGGGQFLLVLRGACDVSGYRAGEHAVAHIGAQDSAAVLVGGPEGVHALLVQFARQGNDAVASS